MCVDVRPFVLSSDSPFRNFPRVPRMRASRLEDEDGESKRTKGREREREEEDESKGKRGMKNDKKSGRTGDQRREKRGGREKDEGKRGIECDAQTRFE